MATTPDPQPRVRPIFLVLGGVLLVAVIGLVIVTLAGREPEPEPTPPPIALPPSTPEPTPEPEEPVEDMDVFEIFEGRDPFRPLVFAPAAPPPDAPPPAPGAPGATPAPPGVPAQPTPVPRREGVQVEVLSVADDSSSATVRVGSQVHQDAQPGQTLSSGVVLASIEGRCVNFRRNGQAFRLCEGEQVHK